jgi:hypothetical protein
MKKFNAHVVTGTATGVTAGSAVSGNALFLGSNTQKVTDLSAVLSVDAETNTLTMTTRWQVSNDSSTWHTIAHAPQNPAGIPIATGTGGADATVNTVSPAPEQALAYQYARCQIVIGAATGTDDDTFSIGYTYRVPRGQARRN